MYKLYKFSFTAICKYRISYINNPYRRSIIEDYWSVLDIYINNQKNLHVIHKTYNTITYYSAMNESEKKQHFLQHKEKLMTHQNQTT